MYSKYTGKCDNDGIENTGRVWGASTDWGDNIRSVVISGRGLVRFIRIIRGYIKSQGSRKMANYMTKNPNTEVFYSLLNCSKNIRLDRTIY